MSKIKVSELFYSIQGEGRYQGVPSIFLRTFGCNFRCKGFGRKKEEINQGEKYNPEVVKIIENINFFKSYNELPLVETGCDSYAAVYPEFKNLSPLVDVEVLAENMIHLLPNKQWQDEHLVITGGEPLLGWQRIYPELLENHLMDTLKEITFETNGTQPLQEDFQNYLNWTWRPKNNLEREITFSVSPKLSCSGEPSDIAINPSVVCEYEEVGYTYLKFVVSTDEDVDEALEATDIYRAEGFKGPVYLMAEGGIESRHSLNAKQVAELAMKHGLRYSDRLQMLWKNEWGK